MKEFIPLIGSQTDRSIDPSVDTAPTKDQLFQNCLFYPVENPWSGKKTIFVEKRPGLSGEATLDTNYVQLTGFYYWKALGTVCRYGYYVPSLPVYRFTPVDSSGTKTAQVTDVTPIFHVSEAKNSSGTPAVFYISSGTTNTYTTVYMFADGDTNDTHITVPSGSCGHLAHIDGYTFIANTNGRIYNSTLNDPTTGYTDFIGADISPDVLNTVWKYKNYLLAFGSHSLEWYRIGEQTTGSPLQRIPEYYNSIGIFKKPTGSGLWGSLASNGPPIVDGNNTIYWVAQTDNGVSVYTLENTTPRKISTSIQDKYLLQFSGYIKYLEIGKRKLILVSTVSDDNSKIWLCYDIELNFWSIWTGTDFSRWANKEPGQGLIGPGTGFYYEWEPGDQVYYSDVATPITRKIRTSIIDMDTNDYKDIPSLSLIGDKASTTENITVKWTKDDYQTWNTGRTIDMSSANPKTHAIGVARRIAFELSETNESPGRLRGIELEYNVRT